MTVTLKEASDKLLRGEPLEWLPQGGLKGGKISLADAGSRRLLAYLLDNPQDLVANADESLFAGLIAAWEKDDDPAERIVTVEGDVRHRWLLKNVRTFNFGGLNAFGGDEFLLPVEGASWCLEGQNGSGKRLRVARGGMAVLESLNPDGTCPSELMSLDGEGGLPKLESAYAVRGVLFELPR